MQAIVPNPESVISRQVKHLAGWMDNYKIYSSSVTDRGERLVMLVNFHGKFKVVVGKNKVLYHGMYMTKAIETFNVNDRNYKFM